MESSGIQPNSILAEKNVLGSMIIDKDIIDDVISEVTADDFYRVDHKETFETIVKMHKKGDPTDLLSVDERIKNFEYLITLIETVSTTQNAKHYAGIVKDKSILRQLMKATQDIHYLCTDEQQETKEVLQKAETCIMNINSNKSSSNVFKLSDCLPEAMNELEARINTKGNIVGIPTGFTDLDYKTGGLQKSNLVLVAGRPAMGKTAFALNIAEDIGIRQNKPVIIFSLEMSKQEVVNRILCSESLVDSHKIKVGSIDDLEHAKIGKSLNPLSESQIYIDDSGVIKVNEMFAKCRKLKKDKGLTAVVIDYIQLMTGSNKNGNREQEVSEITRSLKLMAKELNVPVIALSQLSRGCEQRQEHRPMLSDLRESGAIEQDADIVMFLYRDDYYNPESEKRNVAEVIIAKHRSGGIGTVELVWLPQYTKFSNLEKYRGDAWEPKEKPKEYKQQSFKQKGNKAYID